jgi:hypothetical protein
MMRITKGAIKKNATSGSSTLRKGSLTGRIFMGDGACRDRDVGKHKEIGEPKPAAVGGGVLDRFLDFFQIVGLGGNGRKGRLSLCARCQGLGQRRDIAVGFFAVRAHLPKVFQEATGFILGELRFLGKDFRAGEAPSAFSRVTGPAIYVAAVRMDSKSQLA